MSDGDAHKVRGKYLTLYNECILSDLLFLEYGYREGVFRGLFPQYALS